MKFLTKKIALLCFAFFALMFTSCRKDDDGNEPETVNFSAEDTTRAAQMDNIVEASTDIAESGYMKIEEPDQLASSFFPTACPTFQISGGGNGAGAILIDFGTECQLLNGAVVSGLISISYSAITSGIRNIAYEYSGDFTYNGNSVSGGGTITRDISGSVPKSVIDENIVVAFSGTSITGTRTGIRITEWVEGVGSGTWTDNVFHIEGNWETNLSNGFSRSGVVTQRLIREASCPYLVSGKITVTQEGLTGIIDFGDGTCDPLAKITFEGQEFPIILGN